MKALMNHLMHQDEILLQILNAFNEAIVRQTVGASLGGRFQESRAESRALGPESR